MITSVASPFASSRYGERSITSVLFFITMRRLGLLKKNLQEDEAEVQEHFAGSSGKLEEERDE